MTIVLVVLMSLIVIAIMTFIGVLAIGSSTSERDERARTETEMRRAEYQLHRLASDAFTQMMDAAREHGCRSNE